jgi:hypothetical protein
MSYRESSLNISKGDDMVRLVAGPFKSYMLGNDSKIERGEKGLKKSLIAIALLTFGFGLLISSASYATAPKAGDIPDFRVIAPNGVSNALDLDDYLLDNDDYDFEADTDLSWTATIGVGVAPVASLDANNVLSLAGTAAAGDLGTYTFEVTDPTSQQDSDTSAFKASSAIGVYPALSQDQLLTASATNPGYTYVQDVVGATGAAVLVQTDDAVTAGAAGTDWQEVYISAVYDASLNAAYSPRVTMANGTGSASVTGLQAAINSAGQFTLTATAGGLSAPVIVGFKGINNADPDDWSGVSALVSSALLSVERPGVQEVDPGYSTDDGFETALGSIAQVGFSGAPHNRTFNRLNGPAKNTWVSNVKQAATISGGTYYPSVTVVDDTSLPTGLQGSNGDFAGDHSGNSLCVALAGATSPAVRAAYLVLNSPVSVQAGYAYAVDMSVGSSATTAAAAPQIHLGLHTFGFSEVSVQELGPSAAGSSGPTDAGWIRMRAYIEPSATGLADGTGIPDGLGLTILAINEAATPVNVYIDNVRIYTTALPDDLAWGNAKVAIAGRPDVSVGTRVREYVDPSLALLPGQNVYGDFENGTGAIGPNATTTGGNANAWFHQGASLPTGMTATVNTSAVATRIEAGDANWLEVSFSGAAVGAAGQIRTRLMTPASTVGPLFAPGVYVMSLDYQTPSGVAAPTVLTGITDDGFKTFAYFSNANGTNGALRRVRVAATMRDLDKLIYLYGFASVSASTQTCHIDNVQVDLVNDMTEYMDISLFQ